MIDFYFYPTSNAYRAAIALEECGLPYRRIHVDLAHGEHKTGEFARLNPARKVPFIVDPQGPGGEPLHLAQSAAILMYCAEKSAQFLPTDARTRALVLQWTFAAVTDIGPNSTFARSLNTSRVPEPSLANAQFFEERLCADLTTFDAQLALEPFLVGNVSIADFALYPSVSVAKPILERHGNLTNLLAWADRIAARPAVQRAMRL